MIFRSIADWTELPRDLLVLIFCQLTDVCDVFRFAAVCKSWESAASDARQQPFVLTRRQKLAPLLARQQPFVWTRRQKLAPLLACFQPPAPQLLCHISDTKIHKITTLPLDPYNPRCFINAVQGWLVYYLSDSLCLRNPLSGLDIHLPQWPICKLTLSSTPLDPNCKAAGTLDGQLAVLIHDKRRDRKGWIVMEGPCLRLRVQDIIYCKNNLYGVNNKGEIMLCDEVQFKNFGSPPALQAALPDKQVRLALVESPSEGLLLVMKYDDFRYRIFELSLSSGKWKTAANLRDDISLLMGRNSCISISTTALPQFRRNCIYDIMKVGDIFDSHYTLCAFDLKTQQRCEEMSTPMEAANISEFYWIIPDISFT